ncbi:MAG: hypothetical protein P8008_04775 [Gammaproteobacteria bacterium]
MGALSHDLAISVIAILAVCFMALGIFYPVIADRLGVEEGNGGHRFLSLLIGFGLFALLFIYRLARDSMLAT